MSSLGKCALVTGASRGIGACIAETLASKGYDIAINCRSIDAAAGVAEKCRAFNVQVECFPADVSKFDECGKLIAAVAEKFGSIDLLVNNAGIVRDTLMVRMSEEQFDSVVDVNMKSVFNMMHYAGKLMMRAKKGKIVNITSVVGLYGNPGQVNYSAAKAGIIGMTMTAAKELGPRGITVNAVAPGFIETDMTDTLPDKVKEMTLAGIALGRMGKPSDVANAVAFLASDEASYITGQVLVVDGCMVM